MTERFTERTKKVLQLAREEAGRLHHEYIGTEHLLLGLVAEGSGVAAQVLAGLGVDLGRVRAAVDAVVQPGPPASKLPDKIFLTPRAKRALDAAQKTAREMGHAYIGTEHLLMGLLREGEGVAARVLRDLGLALDQVRATTLEFLAKSLKQGGAKPEEAAAGEEGEAEEEEQEEEEEEGAAPRRRAPQREIPWPDWVRGAVNTPELLAVERRAGEARAAKDAAVEHQDFEGAAQKRDEERRLRASLPRHASLRAVRALLNRPDDPACAALAEAGLDLEAAKAKLDALLKQEGES